MTPEELIAEAYRRYPRGSVFKSIFTDEGRYRKVLPYNNDRKTEFIWESRSKSIRAMPGMKTEDIHGGHACSNPVVYRDGKWAPGREYDVVKEIMERYE